ncbi:MAG: hypothetical protein RBR52_14680 [Thiomonas sp.]|uniref:hypothetical protein n=1 Tax=Thiomonas sp. TaxID=2047785 RepID=UPI002A35AB8C|nr:hypothetical protein [Thiomonas sp.]MDY0331721.1 hypothetical protein [Thiomonas sp.]
MSIKPVDIIDLENGVQIEVYEDGDIVLVRQQLFIQITASELYKIAAASKAAARDAARVAVKSAATPSSPKSQAASQAATGAVLKS